MIDRAVTQYPCIFNLYVFASEAASFVNLRTLQEVIYSPYGFIEVLFFHEEQKRGSIWVYVLMNYQDLARTTLNRKKEGIFRHIAV